LYTAIKNTSLNYLSKKANEQIIEPFDFLDILLEENTSPEQNFISSEIMSKIQNAVEQLPPRCKMIFKLVRQDGLKYKEVADILNISENTVDAQMVIAVKKISEKVKSHFDFFPEKFLKTKPI
jgi:RNA polymerase sigma-70 factor (ECF subfamily)